MRTDCVVVGAGPAGLAMSQALQDRSIEHIVLERGRIATTWRTQRWDSFRLNTPGYMNQMLGAVDPDSFSTSSEVAALLDRIATDLPVREHTPVHAMKRHHDDEYVLQTPDEEFVTRIVVIATGGQNVPRTPVLAGVVPQRVKQHHAATYRNAEQLPDGAVLVVGAAQSGCQIAEDLAYAGRQVYLSTCRVGRYPWRYRGRDTMQWLIGAGYWQQRPQDLDDPALMRLPQPIVASGGRDLSLQLLHQRGVTLLGHLVDVDGESASFDGSLSANVEFGNQFAGRLCAMMDAVIERSGVDAPPAEADGAAGPVPQQGERVVKLKDAGIASIIWCTGFTGDYSWVRLPIVDSVGQPAHKDGATAEPGVWFLGIPWLIERQSGILNGFPRDADRIASAIATRVSDRKSA